VPAPWLTYTKLTPAQEAAFRARVCLCSRRYRHQRGASVGDCTEVLFLLAKSRGLARTPTTGSPWRRHRSDRLARGSALDPLRSRVQTLLGAVALGLRRRRSGQSPSRDGLGSPHGTGRRAGQRADAPARPILGAQPSGGGSPEEGPGSGSCPPRGRDARGEVRETLFRKPDSTRGLLDGSAFYPFHYKMRERRRDRIRYFLRTATIPNESDWMERPLPEELFPYTTC
jgi:hypothetical protein